VVDEGAVHAVVMAARELPRAGPLGGRAHHGNGAYDRRCVLGSPSLRGAALFALGATTVRRGSRLLDPEHGPLEVPADGRRVPVDAVSGAFLAVPRVLWDLLGGFDERFFLYGEDVDLAVRARAANWCPLLVTDAGYRHIGRGSSEAASAGVLLHRGKVELYRRHLDPVRFRLAVVALQLGVFLRGLPSLLPIPALSRRAQPWWQLFGDRRRWRTGYARHVPGTVPA
jgi:N-acetylglucosaminyl-diphospho-decaprenol L-rhamnosyltransferase